MAPKTNTPTPEQKGHFAENWPWYVGGAVVIAAIASVVIFWDKLTGAEEGEASTEGND